MTLAPLDLGDVFGGVLRTWLRNWQLVLTVSAVVALVNAAIGVPFVRQVLLVTAAPPERFLDVAGPHLRTAALLLPVNFAAGGVVAGVAGGVFALICREAVLGRRPPWTQVWRLLRPVLPRLVGLSLVVHLVAGVGLLFCVVPGVVIYTVWSLAIPALVTERLTVGQALRRSYRLVRPDGGRVFAILALLVMVTAATGAALSLPWGGGVQLSLDPGFSETGWLFVLASAAAGLPAGVVTAAVVPFTVLLLYVDQRIRQERYDLQLAQEARG